MTKKSNFIKKIKITGIVLIIITALSVFAVDSYYSLKGFSRAASEIKKEYIEKNKQVVKEQVLGISDMISHAISESSQVARKTVKARVYEAYSVASHIYETNKGIKTDREIKRLIFETLRPVRFKDGKGYYFATRLDGVEQLFPEKPEMEQKNLYNFKDSKGNYVIKDMILIVKNQGEGFYEYYWTKPGKKGNSFKKISFVKKFEPYDFFIGTGLYQEDIEEKIKTSLLSMISKIRFGNDGYIFINRLNGDALVSNCRYFTENKKLWEVFEDSESLKKIFEMELVAAKNPDGDYIEYNLEKLSKPGNISKKISYIYKEPNFQWIIGTGFYMDDVESNMERIKSGMVSSLKYRFYYSAFFSLLISAFFIFWFKRNHKKFEKDFEVFSSMFKTAANKDKSIDTSVINFKEIEEMAENVNTILDAKKEFEKNLEDSRTRFLKITENVNDVIYKMSVPEGRYEYMSPSCEKLFGYSPKYFYENPFIIEKLIHPEFKKSFVKEWQQLLTGQLTPTYEYKIIDASGNERWLFQKNISVKDENGTLCAIEGIISDITEKKKVEQEIINLEKLQSVGILAGGIAHDFNNILMGLYGNISLAKKLMDKNHPGLKYIESAEKSMDRASMLSNRLLTFSRGGSPVREVINLKELVRDVVNFDLSGSKAVAVFNINEDVDAVKADKGQIQQVFSNLVINSLQAMPNGGRIFISMENSIINKNQVVGLLSGNYVKVTIADEGCGIESSDLGKIFNPYFTTKEKGSGLGLAAVYSIIKNHQGSISVSSTLGKGTEFMVYIPSSGKFEKSDKTQADSKDLNSKKSKILIMDDEEVILSIAKEMLEMNGYKIFTALNGAQALSKYKEELDKNQPFDLVIMDLTIPGEKGGIEVLKDILEIDPNVKALVSSGYSGDEVMSNFKNYGFKGVVTKPYTMKKLIEEIEKVIGGGN
jgi:PAS domain S-box-containing protein